MSMLLRHTPGEWDGTFELTAEKMITNLLTDGPVEILVNNEVRLRTLVGYQPGTLVFLGNETEDLSEISEIEVP